VIELPIADPARGFTDELPVIPTAVPSTP
jgi:hypothetical protein